MEKLFHNLTDFDNPSNHWRSVGQKSRVNTTVCWCYQVESLLLQIIVIAKVHPLGRWLYGFSPLLKFFLLLFIQLSIFSYHVRCPFSANLLSRIVGPYHKPFCYLSTQWLYFSTSLGFSWGCADQSIVNHLFLSFLCSILFVLWETVCGILTSNTSPS